MRNGAIAYIGRLRHRVPLNYLCSTKVVEIAPSDLKITWSNFWLKKLAKLFGVLCVSFGQEFLAEKSGRLRRFLGDKSFLLPYVCLVCTLVMPFQHLIFGKKSPFGKKG
jgi:hypothetical protein